MSKKKNKTANEFASKRKNSPAGTSIQKQAKRKIKLVYHGDSPKVNTGFGVVARELLSRLHATGEYEIHSIGINDKGDPNIFPEIAGIHHYALPDYTTDPYGFHKLPQMVRQIKPDVIFTLNDIWIIDGSDKLGSKNWFLGMLKNFAPHTPWVFYFPVDSRPWKLDWANLAFSADKTIVYSKYAIDILKELHPEFNPIYIPHGVTLERFKVIDIDERRQVRATMECNDDHFIVGFVSRNQPRKNPAALIEIFKMANEGYRKCTGCGGIRNLDDPKCEYCGESNEVSREISAPLEGKARCYLHFNLMDNMGIDAVKVINDNKAGKGMIFNPNHSIPYGIPEEHFNRVFNCLDCHLLTTMAEGFGLTVVEGMAAGVPTIATRTTAVTELLEEGGGLAVVPRSHYVFDDAANTRKHIIDYERAIEALKEIYDDWKTRAPGERWGAETKKRVEKGLKFAQSFTWDEAAKQFDYQIKDAIKQRTVLVDQYSENENLKMLFQMASTAGGILQTMPALSRFVEAYPDAEICYAIPKSIMELFEGKITEKVKLIPIDRMNDKNIENKKNMKINIVNFHGPDVRYEEGAYPFIDRSRAEIYCLHCNMNPNDVTLKGMWKLTDHELAEGNKLLLNQVPERSENDFVVGLSPLTSDRSKAWGEGRENWEKLQKYLEKMKIKTFLLDTGASFIHNIAALSLCDLVVTVDGDILDFLHALNVPTIVLISPYWRVRVKGWDRVKLVAKDDIAQRGVRDSEPGRPSVFLEQIGVGEVFAPILTYNKLWKKAKESSSNGESEGAVIAPELSDSNVS